MGSALNGGLRKYVYFLTPEPVFPYLVLLSNTYFLPNYICRCNESKDLEMRSSWIIGVGLKSNDKCPHKRDAEGAPGWLS